MNVAVVEVGTKASSVNRRRLIVGPFPVLVLGKAQRPAHSALDDRKFRYSYMFAVMIVGKDWYSSRSRIRTDIIFTAVQYCEP